MMPLSLSLSLSLSLYRDLVLKNAYLNRKEKYAIGSMLDMPNRMQKGKKKSIKIAYIQVTLVMIVYFQFIRQSSIPILSMLSSEKKMGGSLLDIEI